MDLKIGQGVSGLAFDAVKKIAWMNRPILWLRSAIAIAGFLLIGIIVVTLVNLNISGDVGSISDLAQDIEAVINDFIFVCIGVYFLIGIEGRIKRRRALDSVSELRRLAHLIDFN